VIKDSVSLRALNNIDQLTIDFIFPKSNIIVVTGRNGAGKTTVLKTFNLLSDPEIYSKSSGEDAVSNTSKASFMLDGLEPFELHFNTKLGAFDTKDTIPDEGTVISELPIPYGTRFQQFSKIAKYDADLKVHIASTNYTEARGLIEFLSAVYSSTKFEHLKSTQINRNEFYFTLKDNDYYIREDHFSSGEFFLIQIYRLISSGAKLILVDELDVALDAVAQVNLYSAIKPILQANNSRLIVVSHSLAFMNTVDEGGLYYLEENNGNTSLESRTFGYVKSDLFGFRGYDRYILTEDDVLEGFIEFLIRYFSIDCHYKYITIGLAGDNQLEMIIKKNDTNEIFIEPEKVLCIVDGDVFSKINDNYRGPTKIIRSPADDLQTYLYTNRSTLLSEVGLPSYQESSYAKKASKTYWRWLTVDKGFSTEQLYKVIVESDAIDATTIKNEIETFLSQ